MDADDDCLSVELDPEAFAPVDERVGWVTLFSRRLICVREGVSTRAVFSLLGHPPFQPSDRDVRIEVELPQNHGAQRTPDVGGQIWASMRFRKEDSTFP